MHAEPCCAALHCLQLLDSGALRQLVALAGAVSVGLPGGLAMLMSGCAHEVPLAQAHCEVSAAAVASGKCTEG